MSDQAKLHSVLPRRQTTLGEVATFNSGYRNSQDAVESGEYPFFTCSREVLRHTEFDFDAEAVIMAGNNADARFHLQYYKGKFAARQRTYVITPATPDVDCRYLYFAMHQLQPLFAAQAQGTTTKFVTIGMLRSAPIELPEIGTQRAIAHILGTLNDKIELNRRMNETLEAMARAIFKSWFVDFDPVRAKASGEPPESICRRLGLTPELLALFPDNFQDSELGEVPKGWSIRKVEDISLKVGMGPFGSNIKVSTFVEDGVPVVSGQHLNEEMLDDNTYKFVSVEHANRLASANVGRGDVIFTHAGSIGQVSYIPDHSRYERYVLSQRQFYLRCDPSKVSHLFMTYFFRSPFGQHLLLANASQVGVPSIARPVSYLKSIEFVNPSMNILDRFDRIVRTFHHRVSASRQEIETIANVRDTLLPKLLSGALNPFCGLKISKAA